MEKLHAPHMSIFITSICNLKCKMCGSMFPYAINPHHFALDTLEREIALAFQVYDSCDIFQFMGGEVLLHPHYTQLARTAFKYSAQFERFRITTNGTIPLKSELVDFLNSVKDTKKIEVVVSDYGSISRNIDKIKEICNDNGFVLRIDKYHGDDQYFGGWIDFGDFNPKGNDDDVAYRFKNCACPRVGYQDIYKGFILPCARFVAGEVTGLMPIDSSIVNLFDDESIELKKKRVLESVKGPYSTCYRCNGLLPDSKRIVSAEQL